MSKAKETVASRTLFETQMTYMNRNMSNIWLVDTSIHDRQISTDTLFLVIVPIQDLVEIGGVVELDRSGARVASLHSTATEDEIDGVGHEMTDDSAAWADVVFVGWHELLGDPGYFSDAAAWVVQVHPLG
jgi:hypothetical protein